MDEGWIKPLHPDGSLVQDTYLSVNGDDEQRGEMDVEEWWEFVHAAAGVVRLVRSTGAAPKTAHRYFG